LGYGKIDARAMVAQQAHACKIANRQDDSRLLKIKSHSFLSHGRRRNLTNKKIICTG
jgi:hypothetical protein